MTKANPKYGTVRRQCDGHAVRGSSPGACRMHLGRVVAEVHAKFDLEKRARRLANLAESEPVDVDGLIDEHLALAGEARQWKDILRTMVGELTSVGYQSAAGEQTKAAVRLYGESLDRCDRILTSISKLRLEERQTAVAEAQEIRLRAVLIVAVRRLGLDLNDAAVITAVQQGIAESEPKAANGALR